MGLSTKDKPITPYKGSWAHKCATGENQAECLQFAVESAKKAPVIFHNENINWYMKVFHVSREEARKALGYSKPLATISAAEYRRIRGLSPLQATQ